MNLKELREELINYSKTLAEIKELEFRIIEMSNDLSISAINYDNSIKKSDINNITEKQAIKLIENTDALKSIIESKKIKAGRLENALSILKDLEKDVIQLLLIDRKKIYYISSKIDRDIRSINRIEKNALVKMLKVINLEI